MNGTVQRRCAKCGAAISREASVCPYCGFLDPGALTEAVQVERSLSRADAAVSAGLTASEEALQSAASWQWWLDANAPQVAFFLFGLCAVLFTLVGPSRWLPTDLLAAAVLAMGAFFTIRRLLAPHRVQRIRAGLLLTAQPVRCRSCGGEYRSSPNHRAEETCPYCGARAGVALPQVAEQVDQARRAAQAQEEERREQLWREYFRGLDERTPPAAYALAILGLLLLGSTVVLAYGPFPAREPLSRYACRFSRCLPMVRWPRQGPNELPLEIVRNPRHSVRKGLVVFDAPLDPSCLSYYGARSAGGGALRPLVDAPPEARRRYPQLWNSRWVGTLELSPEAALDFWQRVYDLPVIPPAKPGEGTEVGVGGWRINALPCPNGASLVAAFSP